jgi:hypothetical protein
MAPNRLLTDPQRRHFTVVLAKVEDALDEIDRLARPSAAEPGRRVLTDLANDLPPDFASRTAAATLSARDRLADLATQLGLVPQRASRFRTVRALLNAEIVRLQDSFSPGLRGYGALDPAAPSVIDPALREVVSLLATMLRALDARSEDAAGR